MNTKNLLPDTKIYFLCCMVFIALLLSACGEKSKERELREYIAQLKNAASQNHNTSIASFLQLPKPVRYQPEEYSSPTINGAASVQAGAAMNPLQSYPLKSLQFVGTLEQNGQIHAYIMTPDNMVYEAKEGDIIGNNYGKISKIDPTQIEVIEKYTQSGKSEERKQIMQLKE